jgi:hypothetical protein
MDLLKEAEDKLGKERAAELRSEIEQLADELEKLRSAALEVLEVEDEP